MSVLDEMKEEKIEGQVYEAEADNQEAVADGGKDWRNTLIQREWDNADDDTTQSEFTEYLDEEYDIDLSRSHLSRILGGG
jgi:hypothetical protein